MQAIHYTNNIIGDVSSIIESEHPDRVVLLTDENTHRLCRPLVAEALAEVPEIVIGATDVHKTIDTLQQVWCGMQDAGCTRHSLLINLGGGMVTDLGGFAAATFKRGVRFVNIPTTLLSMVDAAVGGKTGINYRGLKNEIGAFAEAQSVIICTEFLRTLDTESSAPSLSFFAEQSVTLRDAERFGEAGGRSSAPHSGKNIRSGYAEMLKHSLLGSNEMWSRHISFNLAQPDFVLLQQLVRESIELKQCIVAEDPHEQGIRKALNLGHTVGHAFESFLMDKGAPVLHGYAVAWGLGVELFMSAAQLSFPTDKMRQTVRFITDYYGRPDVTCDDYESLFSLMLHDKKNVAGRINFTLLSSPGEIHIDQKADKDIIFDALDFLREA